MTSKFENSTNSNVTDILKCHGVVLGGTSECFLFVTSSINSTYLLIYMALNGHAHYNTGPITTYVTSGSFIWLSIDTPNTMQVQ